MALLALIIAQRDLAGEWVFRDRMDPLDAPVDMIIARYWLTVPLIRELHYNFVNSRFSNRTARSHALTPMQQVSIKF